MPQTNESILKSQHFELIYAQLGFLYIVIPVAPHPHNQPKPGAPNATNEVIRPMSQLNPYGWNPSPYNRNPHGNHYGPNLPFPRIVGQLSPLMPMIRGIVLTHLPPRFHLME